MEVIEEIRKMINDEYHKAQRFEQGTATYPDRMRHSYHKDAIISTLNRFVGIIDTKLLELSKLNVEEKE